VVAETATPAAKVDIGSPWIAVFVKLKFCPAVLISKLPGTTVAAAVAEPAVSPANVSLFPVPTFTFTPLAETELPIRVAVVLAPSTVS
jgi:hypothetical protein